MIRFECDYGEGAAQPVLDLLQKTNLEQTPGYGMDDYCDQARGLIRKLCDAPDAGVHFFVGATQANFTVVDALLKPWQGVLCADSGHINVHETGAVEATGHKCLALPSVQGKITAQQVRDAYDAHWADASHEHLAQPGMVYISNPTEDGTLYTKEELTDLSATCYDCGL
ncbi:MAG TPA: low specificity L-threonine aldolase, partial [Ruminococcaceae bacterium]|nr:low specificity L-threonine aldolase [Oscillospiraceae bacterium]